ncbi:NADPH-dependent FMN reductase [Nocardia sp. NPDC088792]|uniref:NADPH-dependent FMN reductase n=1 Tax=Nocardia sp. NPDC088792 TaxID=3364332 RepID=UPI00381CB7D9
MLQRGGLSGGLRAVEHLRQVFAEPHAVTLRDTVSFHGAAQQFDASSTPIDPEASTTAAEQLLEQIEWWGRALRSARAEHPYAAPEHPRGPRLAQRIHQAQIVIRLQRTVIPTAATLCAFHGQDTRRRSRLGSVG